MRPIRSVTYMSCLLLCFVSGWLLRGVFDLRVQEGQRAGVSIFGDSESSISSNEAGSLIVETESSLSNSSDLALEQLEASFDEKEVLVNSDKELSDEIVKNIQDSQFQSAFKNLLLAKADPKIAFDDHEINHIGSAFLLSVIDISLDEYIGSEFLLDLGNQVSVLDPYSPYAQFFQVVLETDRNPALALSDLDALSSYYQEQITESQLRLLEDWILNRVERNLYANQDWQSLEEWYSVLIARAVDPSEIYRRQASLQYEQERYMDSLESLDLISNYSEWSTSDESLYKKNREFIDKDNVAFIQLERLGEHYIASLRLNNRIEVKMLMDTGASISALDYQFTQTQGMRGNGDKIRLATASGQVEADLFSISSTEFGAYKIANLEFAGIDLGGSSQRQYQGLLGMDILGKFEFYLDQREAVLYLNADENINKSLFGF